MSNLSKVLYVFQVYVMHYILYLAMILAYDLILCVWEREREREREKEKEEGINLIWMKFILISLIKIHMYVTNSSKTPI